VKHEKGEHEKAEELKKVIEPLKKEMGVYKEKAEKRNKELDEVYKKRLEVEKKLENFAKLCRGMNLRVEKVATNVMKPIVVQSVKEVVDLIKKNESEMKSYENKKDLLEINELNQVLTEAGEEPAVYSSFTNDEITDKYKSVGDKLKDKQTKLEEEKKRQEEYDRIIKEWEKKCEEFNKWAAEKKKELAVIQETKIEDQIKKLKEEKAPLAAEEGKKKIEELEK